MLIRNPVNLASKPWYSIQAAAKDVAEVLIYDEISSWGITAENFVKDLQGVTAKTINLRINSPGGSVFDGTAIFNALRAHPAKVVSHIDGVAASIASIIALAADEVRMAENAFYMIHNAWGVAMGDGAEMRKMADILDKIAGTLAKTYAAKTGSSVEAMQALMDAQTWMTAEEAKAAGFVDAVDGTTDAKATFDLSRFANVPAALLNPKNQESKAEDYAPDVRKMRMRVAVMERGFAGQPAHKQ